MRSSKHFAQIYEEDESSDSSDSVVGLPESEAMKKARKEIRKRAKRQKVIGGTTTR